MRPRKIYLLAISAILLGCMGPTAARSGDDLFERHEVVTGVAQGQTVLTGFFRGGSTAELVAIQLDEAGDRRLRMYGFDGGAWISVLEASLGPEVLFVDVANSAGSDRLITVEPGRVTRFDPDSGTRTPLIEVAPRYNAAPSGLRYGDAEPTGPFDEGEIPRVDITRDLNHDGRDDLVVPDVDGFWISTQSGDGSFTDPVKLGAPEPFRDEVVLNDTRKYGEVGITALTIPWYLSRVHEMDYNQDGRSDLVFWNDGHFEVHYQNARGEFDPAGEAFVTDVAFDSVGVYSLMFGFADESLFSLAFGFRKSSDRTVLHSFQDVNADQVADLVTLTISGRSLLRQRTRYGVHYGTPTPDGLRFARDAGTAIQPRAKAPLGYSFQWLLDVDGDGPVDILHGHVKTGLGKAIRALIGGSVTLGLEAYRLEEGLSTDKATAARVIRTDLGIRGGRDAGFFPAVLVGDVNGDGLADLTVGKSREKLLVFLGAGDPELWSTRPVEVAVAVPGDERNSWLVDLDEDGRRDVLMHHPSATEPHRVTLLIAR